MSNFKNGIQYDANDFNAEFDLVAYLNTLASHSPGKGSALVADDSGATVHDLLPIHLQFSTYADLRNYAYFGADIVQVKGDGIAGIFKADPSDTTTADNGGTVIVANDGTRWKRLNDQTSVTLYSHLKNAPGYGRYFIHGRNSIGDGGGGQFIWQSGDQSSHVTNDPSEYIWVAPNSDITGTSGAWLRVRQELSTIYASWGGVVFDNATNNTTAIDNGSSLIQKEFKNGKGTFVLNGDGRALADYVTLKNGVNLQGQGGWLTCELGPTVSAQTEFLQLDTGIVESVTYRDFSIVGSDNTGAVKNAGQYAFGINATANTNGVGGLWYTLFENIRIEDFDSIWRFKGGDAAGSLPNQFITFVNVVCKRRSATGYTINATGQNAQFTFIGGKYDGDGTYGNLDGSGTNIWLHPTTAGDDTPKSWTFIDSTTQVAGTAIHCESAEDINFIGGWLENLKYGVYADSSSFNVNLRGTHIANVGSDGASTGYVMKLGSDSSGALSQCTIEGTYDYVMDKRNARKSVADVTLKNQPAQSFYYGYPLTVAVSSGNAINVKGVNEAAITNSSGYKLDTINDDHSPHARIVMKIINATSIGTAGNIAVGSRSTPLSISANAFVTFYKQEAPPGKWLVESIN